MNLDCQSAPVERRVRRSNFKRGDFVKARIAGALASGVIVKIEGTSAIVCIEGEGVYDRRYNLNEIMPA